MQILQVIPITKSITAEVLTYFSVKDVDLGTLVTVPLRKKEIKAMVVKSESVVNMKAQLRGANYQIRNILTVHESQAFSPEFLKTCELIKNFYASTTGRVLNQITPTFILKNLEEWEYRKKPQKRSRSFRQLLLQRNYDDRISYYKTLIREHMFQKESLHIICPTINDCDTFFQILKKNNNHVFLLHSKMTQKKLKEIYAEIITLNTPSTLISTPGFIDTPQYQKSNIIMEKESSEYYRGISSPYLDMRIVIQKYAEYSNIHLTFADSALRPETYYLSTNNQAEVIAPFNKRIFKTDDIVIINQHAKKKNKQTDSDRIQELSTKKEFSSLSKKALKKIKEAILKKEKIFLFVHKKGLAPTTVCNDCGNIACSTESGLPYALYIKRHPKTRVKERVFVCTMTGESIPAFDTCQFCQGYNLVSLGIGTERVYDEIQKLFPRTETHIIDSSHVKTQKMMKTLIKEYSHTRKAMIIIGTQKAITELPFIDTTIIVSLDSYFSRMSYNTHSEILNLVIQLREKTKKQLILQSRNITESSLAILYNGLYPNYIENELDERKKYNYPPYKTICTLRKVVLKKDIKKEYELLSTSFNKFNPHIMTHPALKKTMVTLIMFLELDKKTWSLDIQDEELNMLLRGFDRNTQIKFNPKNLA